MKVYHSRQENIFVDFVRSFRVVSYRLKKQLNNESLIQKHYISGERRSC